MECIARRTNNMGINEPWHEELSVLQFDYLYIFQLETMLHKS